MKDLTIVVGTIGQSIMRSEDNGKTWARIGPRRGFAYEASVRCIAMHPRQARPFFSRARKGDSIGAKMAARTGSTSTPRSTPIISGR